MRTHPPNIPKKSGRPPFDQTTLAFWVAFLVRVAYVGNYLAGGYGLTYRRPPAGLVGRYLSVAWFKTFTPGVFTGIANATA